MTRVGKTWSVIALVAVSLGCFVARETPMPPETGSGTASPAPGVVCLAPFWGGVLAGYTEDDQVVRLFGTGYFDDRRGDTGSRSYTDASRSVTLTVEFGTDRFVTLLELELGTDPMLSAEVLERMESNHLPLYQGIGVWREIHLGDEKAKVQTNMGTPLAIWEGPSPGLVTWTYESICACELPSGFSFTFRDDELIKFAVWS